MEKSKERKSEHGFTIIEVCIAIAITLIITLVGLTCSTSVQRSNDCEKFGDYPMDKVPAKCIKYFKD